MACFELRMVLHNLLDNLEVKADRTRICKNNLSSSNFVSTPKSRTKESDLKKLSAAIINEVSLYCWLAYDSTIVTL